jgi:hypothetical protein
MDFFERRRGASRRVAVFFVRPAVEAPQKHVPVLGGEVLWPKKTPRNHQFTRRHFSSIGVNPGLTHRELFISSRSMTGYCCAIRHMGLIMALVVISASCSSQKVTSSNRGNATSVKIGMDFGKLALPHDESVKQRTTPETNLPLEMHYTSISAKEPDVLLQAGRDQKEGARERKESETLVFRDSTAKHRKTLENNPLPEMHMSISAKEPPASRPTERRLPTYAKLTATTAAMSLNTAAVVARRQLTDGPLSWGQLKTSCESSACDISNGAGCTIVLSDNFIMGSYTSEINFSGKAITIWGQGKVLDALGGGRFFRGGGAGSFLELHHAVLQNGNADDVSGCMLVVMLFWSYSGNFP